MKSSIRKHGGGVPKWTPFDARKKLGEMFEVDFPYSKKDLQKKLSDLCITDIAKKANVSLETIYRWCRLGGIKIKLQNKGYRTKQINPDRVREKIRKAFNMPHLATQDDVGIIFATHGVDYIAERLNVGIPTVYAWAKRLEITASMNPKSPNTSS